MNLRSDLYRSRASIDFIPLWKRSVPASGALFVVALVLLLTVGLNKSIDFEGGGIFEAPVGQDVDVADARAAISDSEARVQIVKNEAGDRSVRVQTGSEALEDTQTIVSELAELGDVSTDEVSINTVGPTWGDQITSKAVRALLIFFVVVAAYLAWTLEWRMALGALVAVIHDLVITAGVYAALRLEVSPATVIALLTIMGYSLYDTVVVYDKVLENEMDTAARSGSYTDMVNGAMNQVIMRSINTTITTVLPVFSMLVVGSLILGGTSLQGFSVALCIGLILGTYSSLFLAAPMLAWLKEREDEDVAESNLREKRRTQQVKAQAAADRNTGQAI